MSKPFPVTSTSVETPSIRRVCRVLGRASVSDVIASGGCYSCRPVAGSLTYSQHSWGNAVDLFPKGAHDPELVQAYLRRIANAVVRHATTRTVANRGRRLPIAQVIDHDARRIWEPGKGWHPYSGTTGAHVHVSGAPMHTGRPPCA